jgi:hypothetical protein
VLFTLLSMVVGCASNIRVAERTDAGAGTDRVLLISPDVSLSEMTAGGLNEPRADWTAAARLHLSDALAEHLQDHQDVLVSYREPINDPVALHAHEQLVKLHEAVGRAILIHHYSWPFKLPTKENKLDYSLGDGVKVLAEGYDCRYGLFVYLRDSYATAGRIAAMVTAVALGSSGMHLGTQVGFASLIDLETGEVIWFNRLLRQTGDLRTKSSARETVDELLTGFPL